MEAAETDADMIQVAKQVDELKVEREKLIQGRKTELMSIAANDRASFDRLSKISADFHKETAAYRGIIRSQIQKMADGREFASEADKKAKAATIKEEKTSTGKAYTVEGGKTTAEGKPVGPQSAPSMTGNKIEGLGKIAAHFESGGKAGTVSSGHGDFGGKSYGAFQLAGRGGAAGNEVDQFLKSSGYADKFKGMKVGSADFDAKWKEMGNDKDFAKAQQEHAKKTHYDPQMEKLKKSGVDLSGKGAGVQEAVMSTANQYGANTETIIKALKGKDTAKMDDKEIINAIQNYKAENVKTNFRSSSSAVQAGVAKRIEQERAALLGVQGPTAQGQVKMEDGVKVKTPLSNAAKPTATPATTANPDLAKGAGAPRSGTNPVTPSSTQAVEQATKDKEQERAKAAEQEKAAAEKARTEMAQNDPRRVDKKTAPGAGQETPESLLAQLNTKMDQLIQVSKRTADLNDRQLSVQKGLSSDLYSG
jgi:hypothetical protein